MFGITLRILLIIGSLLTIVFMMLRIRASKVQIRDSIFWTIFAIILLVISIFPEITIWASRLLAIQSPINFVYLFIIFLLLIKLFTQSMQISQLDARVQQLAQRMAINDKKLDDMLQNPSDTSPADEPNP